MAGPYTRLGPRPVTAAKDTSGLNPGNWTAVLNDTIINVTVSEYEMYHMYIKSPLLVGVQTTAQVLLNNYFWDATLVGQLNSWDPSQPMLMQPGDVLYVLFNVPVATTPAPTVTCWFRYQP